MECGSCLSTCCAEAFLILSCASEALQAYSDAQNRFLLRFSFSIGVCEGMCVSDPSAGSTRPFGVGKDYPNLGLSSGSR